jgi:hypothetical protein
MINGISLFFQNELSNLNCDENTKSYIIGIFYKYRSSQFDYSGQSITIKFAEAKASHNFESYQNLADYLFFMGSIFPEYLNYTSKDYYQTIGRLSYYTCYRLINKQWKSFEELSDRFPELENETRNLLNLK